MSKKKEETNIYPTVVPSLTEEQKTLFETLEKEFKTRYTVEEDGFRETMEKDLPPPPVMPDWIRFRDNWRNDSGNRGRYSYPPGSSRQNYESYRSYKRNYDDDESHRSYRQDNFGDGSSDSRERFSHPHKRGKYQ